jgi:MoaA/NifB/PqqE/SkfB family radical SAM enzyme
VGTRLHGSVIVTYRCNAKCQMCDVWHYPTKPLEEIGLKVVEKLPETFFINITGGEPFVRKDLPDLVAVLLKKTKRIVISTNGFFTERIVDLCKRYPNLGIRISIEGLQQANDLIRGIPEGYNRTLNTLRQLQTLGMKDIGFAMTVQDANYRDVIALYTMARDLNYEFATATVHNSHYFHKWDNIVQYKSEITIELKKLIVELLRSKRAKEWFRAYFNNGLINFIQGKPRFLPCEMGKNGFFLDPFGDVLVCNGMDRKEPLGNLHKQTWDEIWTSKRADEVRAMVGHCSKNCWMIGSAAPAMYSHPLRPTLWVLRNKTKLFFGRDIDCT